MTVPHRFVLLTAAKNEERHIGLTIESVLRQSERPSLWIITDDGSTDRTAEIVAEQASRHPFIRLRRGGGSKQRSFGAQYRALVAAWETVRHESCDFVGMLDADIELPQPDYFARLFAAFDADPRLGIAGGTIQERAADGWRDRRTNALHSVAGAVQMFRRACYEQVGGYHPQRYGGEDWLAQIESSAAGWTVRSIADLPVRHHRPTSSADGQLRGLFRLGMRDASFGSHPLFEVAKCLRRVAEPPLLVSALVRLGGYAWYALRVRQPGLPADRVALLRREQVRRLGGWWRHPSRRGAAR